MNMNIYEGVNVSEIICSYGKDVIIAQKFCKTVLVLHANLHTVKSRAVARLG